MVGYTEIAHDGDLFGKTGQTANIQSELLEDVDKIHEPPPGFILRDENEEAIWRSLMKSRNYKDWAPAELILACRVVRQEMLVRRGFEQLDRYIAQGADPFDPDSIACDYNAKLMAGQRLLVFMLRALGFTRGNLVQTKNEQNRASRERQMGELLDSVGYGLPSFLAAS